MPSMLSDHRSERAAQRIGHRAANSGQACWGIDRFPPREGSQGRRAGAAYHLSAGLAGISRARALVDTNEEVTRIAGGGPWLGQW